MNVEQIKRNIGIDFSIWNNQFKIKSIDSRRSMKKSPKKRLHKNLHPFRKLIRCIEGFKCDNGYELFFIYENNITMIRRIVLK